MYYNLISFIIAPVLAPVLGLVVVVVVVELQVGLEIGLNTVSLSVPYRIVGNRHCFATRPTERHYKQGSTS